MVFNTTNSEEEDKHSDNNTNFEPDKRGYLRCFTCGSYIIHNPNTMDEHGNSIPLDLNHKRHFCTGVERLLHEEKVVKSINKIINNANGIEVSSFKLELHVSEEQTVIETDHAISINHLEYDQREAQATKRGKNTKDFQHQAQLRNNLTLDPYIECDDAYNDNISMSNSAGLNLPNLD